VPLEIMALEDIGHKAAKAGTARNPKSCILAEKVKEGVPLSFDL
jgi:hypothetical protein